MARVSCAHVTIRSLTARFLHRYLVAGTNIIVLLAVVLVDAVGNVRTLLLNGHQQGQGLVVEA